MVLKQLLTRSLLSAALLGAVSTTNAQPYSSEIEAPRPRMERKRETRTLTITPRFGFIYKSLPKVPSLERYLDQTRAGFVDTKGDETMPGFGPWFQVSDQSAFLTAGIAWEIVGNRDSLEFNLDFDFASSAIFGKYRIAETFDAQTLGIKLGPTANEFQQKLDFYGRLRVGVTYTLGIVDSKYFRFGVAVGVDVGPIYYSGSSTLDTLLDASQNKLLPAVGWKQANELGVYEHINTLAETSGWGAIVNPRIGVSMDISKWARLGLTFSLPWEIIPNFKIKEHTARDEQRPSGKTEDKTTYLRYSSHGFEFMFTIGVPFGVPYKD